MRLFVAATLERGLRETVWVDAAPLRETIAGVKWVRPELMHLTLKFIGEVNESDGAAFSLAVREAVGDARAVRSRVGGIGAFPNLRRPRVVWVGVDDGGALSRIAARVDAGCSAFGVQRDARPYSPHLTLGRVKGELQARETHALREIAERVTARHETSIDRIALVRSTLGPGGPRYEELEIVTLVGGAV